MTESGKRIGLGHYEGRGWHGFHHYATLAIAAYGFLTKKRGLIPTPRPDDPSRSSKRLRYPTVIDPAAPPVRPERHIANSITTIGIKLTRSLAQSLPRCPCCQKSGQSIL